MMSTFFKLLDESQVVLRAPRQNGVYNLDLKNIVPSRGITCLYANATTDESKLWHKILGHVNFKNINKFVKGHLVRGLPSIVFVNDHTCVACKKGKQHKASYKAKLERTIRKLLELFHMDLFGPDSVESINKKKYCLVVTDDFSRFSWVFFLATKDKTNEILYKFITGLENQLNHKVKIIRSDHETEFKNHAMNEFYAKKGIKREFSVASTPQQNGVAERKNRALIEAARTMLADSLLPIPFWAEAVNTACYVLNRILVTKPQNKTPYELLIGKPPSISFMRPFGCPLTILNTLDPLGKFDGKSDEGYLLGYSTSSKAFRVYSKRTKRIEENMHIDFLEDQPNVAGSGPD
ncbi:putative ribonuclease H-like domain-containing protein [Tanacetum coccineum]